MLIARTVTYFVVGLLSISSKSMLVLVHADPRPSPAPIPAIPFRAAVDTLPVRANTIPVNPPSNKPAVVWTIIFSNPFCSVSETMCSDLGLGGAMVWLSILLFVEACILEEYNRKQ
jgi:hypothetical protein